MAASDSPRFGFVTCVQLGLSCMEAIYEAGGHLDLIVTLRDDLSRRKAGRVHVDDFAREHLVNLVKIRHINDSDAVAAIRGADLDWLFIIGWSQIASPELLSAPSLGALGVHPTLLPEGRGRAAIPWAILKGLSETGVTLFKLDAGVDTGPILAQERLTLSDRETATSLYSRVAAAHKAVIGRTWPALVAGTVGLVPQDESLATVWEGRAPEDGRILPSMTVAEADRLVRATTRPYPGAFFDTAGQRLRIWAARPPWSSPDPQTPGLVTTQIALSDGVLTIEEWDEEPLPGR